MERVERETQLMNQNHTTVSGPRPDPEVKPKKATRRKMSAKYKQSVLEKTDAMLPGEVGAFLRREGLYSSHLSTWRKQRAAGQLAGLEPKTRGAKPQTAEARRVKELEADVARLQSRLETAELVISVQKKLCELFGVDPMTGERISQR